MLNGSNFRENAPSAPVDEREGRIAAFRRRLQ